MRWKIKIFHKILRSGCKPDEVKLRTTDRLVNLRAIYCILSWRVFWVTMSSRSSPEAPPETALTNMEIKVLDRFAPDKPRDRNLPAGIGCYAVKIARLGGYLARSRDPPPGNTVMWRSLSRLTDIMLGMTMADELVGDWKLHRRGTQCLDRRIESRARLATEVWAWKRRRSESGS